MNISKIIYNTCSHPVRTRIWDAYSQSYIIREVPCGHCLHCRLTRVNEWVTRLYAEQKESNYTYYVTLDYAPFDVTNPVALQLANETAAMSHSINKFHTSGIHPIVLCKNHLDDYLKRLRKNTGLQFRFFGCGEYGSSFGRPHFHLIVFSDSPIKKSDFERAWSIDGYRIGRVDFNDLVKNGTTQSHNKNNKFNRKYVFRYVCKYLQKGFVDFEKLPTIEFHKRYFKSLQFEMQKSDTLFPEKVEIIDSSLLAKNWIAYCKKFSPFTCCSRRPAIGFSYLQKNLQRFNQGDLRLFGLSKECSVFPSYFLRKAKESACRYVTLGKITQMPSTASRLRYVSSVLREVVSLGVDISSIVPDSQAFWRVGKGKLIYTTCDEEKKQRLDFESCRLFASGLVHYSIPFSQLHIYDIKDNILYQFVGNSYNVWYKYKNKFDFVDNLSISEVLHLIDKDESYFFSTFVDMFHQMRIIREHDLESQKKMLFPDAEDCLDLENRFEKWRTAKYNEHVDKWNRIALEYSHSHITF